MSDLKAGSDFLAVVCAGPDLSSSQALHCVKLGIEA